MASRPGLSALSDGGREAIAGRELESEIAASQKRKHGRARARTMTEAVADGGAAAVRPLLCCTAAAAYVAAQCSTRNLGDVAQCWHPLLEQHASAALSSPMVLCQAVSQAFFPANAPPQNALPTPQEALNALASTAGILIVHELLRHMFIGLVRFSRRSSTSWDDVLFGCGLVMFPDTHIFFDDHVSHHTSIGSRATGSGPKNDKTLPLTLRFASVGENVQHTLYGLEALIYNISVLMLAASLALICTVDLTALADSWFQETMKSTFLCSMLLRIVTPLQSLSALFIADIGRYVGHTPSELQEIREGLILLSRCVRGVLWAGALVVICAHAGVDPYVALSGFGAGSLFVAIALRKTVEDAIAVVSLLMSAPFKVGDTVQFGNISGPVVKIGFRTTHVQRKYDGHVVQVPNTLLASQQIDNGSVRELRRQKFTFQFVPGQAAHKLSTLQPLMQDVFSQPSVANWQQYLGETDAATLATANAAGPTVLEAAVFTGSNAKGAFELQVDFHTPHPSWQAHRQTRHVAFVACVEAFEAKGLKLAHFPAAPS